MSMTFDNSSERDWPLDQRYMGRCVVCGNTYCGPKRSVICFLCANTKKTVDKENKQA